MSLYTFRRNYPPTSGTSIFISLLMDLKGLATVGVNSSKLPISGRQRTNQSECSMSFPPLNDKEKVVCLQQVESNKTSPIFFETLLYQSCHHCPTTPMDLCEEGMHSALNHLGASMSLYTLKRNYPLTSGAPNCIFLLNGRYGPA